MELANLGAASSSDPSYGVGGGTSSPRAGGAHGHPHGDAHSFSFMVGVAFSLNYIMGTGFLTLPWAFSQTGSVLSTLSLAIIIIPSVVAVLMVLEAMSRADAYSKKYLSFKSEEYEKIAPNLDDDFEDEEDVIGAQAGAAIIDTSTASTASDASAKTSSHLVARNVPAPAPVDPNDPTAGLIMVRAKKFEIVELCDIFLGHRLRLIFMGFLSLYMYGTLWAYSTVFANAMALNLPIAGDNSYIVYLLLFSAIVLPMSCMELKEQVGFQVLLSFGRVLMVLLMLSTVAHAHFSGSEEDFNLDAQAVTSQAPSLINFSGLHHIIPVATFANIFHHSIPALSQPVKDKTQLASIFSTTLLCCFVAYSLIGLCVSLYFGEKTMSSSNLNWIHYGNNSEGMAYVIKRAISTYVVLFPALDVASAFPLNAITLGNNLLSTIYGSSVHLVEHSRVHRVVFRLSAAGPALVAASFVSNLGTITDYTGVSGFGIAFIFPALLSYFSHEMMVSKGLPSNTLYSNFLTTPVCGVGLIAFGIFLLVYVPYSLSQE